MNTFERLKEVRKKTEKVESGTSNDRNVVKPTFVPVNPEAIDWVMRQDWRCQQGHLVHASVHVIGAMLTCPHCLAQRWGVSEH